MGQLQSSRSVWKDPGVALDQVISQSHEEGQCLLYKLANYKKGGELLDAYRIGGGREVEKLIRETFSVFMYNEGRGREITRTEYLKWKLRGKTRDECALSMEPGEKSRFDPLNFWQDHEACWQMQYRGNLGETLLHVLIICNTRAHSRIAKILLKCFPKLAIDVVEGQEYLGASCLHLAIAYNNNDFATQLIEANASVEARAMGSFFLPRDQQREVPRPHTDYEGLAYFGETLLNWSACCNNESCYNMLVERGADPSAQDSFGNMVLHMIVVCDKMGESQSEEMFGYALRHPKHPAQNGILNRANLTPLTLACRLARSEIFREMLELTAIEFWRYSNITCSAYPLNALDTIGPDGKINWNSALMMILNGKKEEHLNMLEGGIIQRLLEEKWQSFARAEFLRKLFIMLLHLVSISVAMYLRPDLGQSLLGTTTMDIVRNCFEATTIIGCLYYMVMQSGKEIRNQGFLPFLIQLLHDPVQLMFNVSSVVILGCVPLRVLQLRSLEELALTLAVPCAWFHLMFFAGAIQLTGPFVTMVFKIITNDMVTFFIIYSIFLLAFTQAFFFLYKGSPKQSTSKFASYVDTWMALFHMTLGDFDFSELSRNVYAPALLVTFVLFMVLVPILLLNMLIAMMGNTYATVVQQSEKEWVKQWANIVITLERGMGSVKCKEFLESYSLPLPGGEPARRGVVVIKSKSKTRARQRKGALINWKRVGRVTMRALKRRKISGEMLRKEMWGLESIHTTPVKGAKGRNKRTPAGVTSADANVLQSLAGLAPPPAGELTTALNQLSVMPATARSESPTSSVHSSAQNGAPLANTMLGGALGQPSLPAASTDGAPNTGTAQLTGPPRSAGGPLGGALSQLSSKGQLNAPVIDSPGNNHVKEPFSQPAETQVSLQPASQHQPGVGHDNPVFTLDASSDDELPALFARELARASTSGAAASRHLLTVPEDPFDGQVLESYRQLRSERQQQQQQVSLQQQQLGLVRLPPIGAPGQSRVADGRPALVEEQVPAPLDPDRAALLQPPPPLHVPPMPTAPPSATFSQSSLAGLPPVYSQAVRQPPQYPPQQPAEQQRPITAPAAEPSPQEAEWAKGAPPPSQAAAPPAGEEGTRKRQRPRTAAFDRERGRVRNINAIVPWEDDKM